MKILGRLWLCCGLVLSAFASGALAQGIYPSKAIRLVVPFPPGGSPDILARTIGQKITEATGAAVVIENIAGAGGSIGADRVAKASPDGYTLLMLAPKHNRRCRPTKRGKNRGDAESEKKKIT